MNNSNYPSEKREIIGISAFLLMLIFSIPVATADAQNYANNTHINDSETPYYIRPLPTLYGFATLNGGVTGGEGGTEVTVTTAEELLRFASSNDPYIINVVDTIEIVRGIGNYNESWGEYHMGSNTTLRGVGPNATILYGGFRITEAHNIIIQNIHFDGTYNGFSATFENYNCNDLPAGVHRYSHGECLSIGEKAPTDKALNIENGSSQIWITQNTFRRYSDEIMAIKREATNVTLSWNDFEDPITGKNGMLILIGHSDNHVADIGYLNTTLHHNYFAARDRQPRVRFGKVHIFNNYYANPSGVFSYGAAAQRDSEVAIEGNYYNNVGNRPWRFDINSFQGYVDQRDNEFVGTNIAQTRGSFGDEVFEPADFYEYTMDDASDIPDIVMAFVGSGNWDYTSGESIVPALTYASIPAHNSTVDVRPEFMWSEARFAEKYQLQVAESVIFAPEDIAIDTLITATDFQPTEALSSDGVYFWRVRAVNEKGGGGWTTSTIFFTENVSSIAFGSELPQKFELKGNYPNPFNPSTNIQFGLPQVATVDIRVFDVLGREVATLINKEQFQPGYHTVQFDTRRYNLASGVYVYRMVARQLHGNSNDVFVQTKSMTLVK